MKKDFNNHEERLKELEKKLKASQNDKQYMLGTKLIKDILNLLRNNNNKGKFTEKITKYKKLLLENNKLASDDFQNVSVSSFISDEDMNKVFEPFLEEQDFEVLMRKLGHNIIIDNNKVVSTQDDNASTLLPFCNIDVYDDEGNLVKGGSDYETYNYHYNYNLHLGVRDMHLSLIYQKLFQEKKLSTKNIRDYFRNKAYIFPNSQSLFKFEAGLKEFGEGNYIASIHILVPILEQIIMYISSLMELDTVTLNRGKKVSTIKKAFTSEFVMTEDFRNKGTENFAILLNNVFLAELGYKLRHKVAHGEIGFFECDYRRNVLILNFFIAISSIVQINIKD